jgi:DNA gyrase/topoisomerase IV subunit B
VAEYDYSLADLTIVEFDDSVRGRPGMYFGASRTDPRLATWVLRTVVGHAFHPATRAAASHTPDVVAEVTADLAFSVTDDQAETLVGRDLPQLGYFGSLLTPVRWSSAAAAAVSSQTLVEDWRDGRGFRQRLNGARPVEPPVPFTAAAGAGTRVAYLLDPAYFGSTVILAEIAALDVHGPHCTDPAGPSTVLIRDRRVRDLAAEYPYA